MLCPVDGEGVLIGRSAFGPGAAELKFGLREVRGSRKRPPVFRKIMRLNGS
jgi:hypothetical protein